MHNNLVIGLSPPTHQLDTIMNNPRILIVDDDDYQRLLRCVTLNRLGFMNLCEAEDGAQALKKLHDEHFDLVISDIDMPKMNGFELLIQMATLGMLTRTKVIMMTARTLAEDMETARRFGASAYLLKTVNKDQLLRAIETTLG